MIILGDIAAPDKGTAQDLQEVFKENSAIFEHKLLVANLEGLVDTSEEPLRKKTPVLFNHSDTIEVLSRWNAAALVLANNHTLDLPHRFKETARLLSLENISFTGAGASTEAAKTPVRVVDHGNDVWIFNYCWNFLFYHQRNPSNGVFLSDMNESKISNVIEQHRQLHPKSSIVVFFHWSFDLETLPTPMNREFAKHLIDLGVNIVVGCHSHCVQGGEQYKQGYIVYGLGNFFLPNNIFANGKLSFPKWASLQLALEWNPITNKAICHWFEYVFNGQQHKVNFIASEAFESSKILKQHSPFQNLSPEQYLLFYKAKRRKKKFIPVFKDFRATKMNSIKLTLLKLRANLARLMARFGFIQWQH